MDGEKELVVKILVSDYSGHPFQVQLARQLSAMGHEVAHVYFAGFQTPKGDLQPRQDDPSGFSIHPVTLEERFDKQSFLKRRTQEINVGKRIGRIIEEYNPDVVLSSNAPLDAQRSILRASRRTGARFAFWLQDIYSEAIKGILQKKFGFVGRQIGLYYQRMEVRLLRRSNLIVAISDDFTKFLRDHRISERVVVVENWVPLSAFLPPENSAGRPGGAFRFVYAGTLGYKHDLQMLLMLAKETDAEVRVYSEGPGADHLRQQAALLPTGKLVVSDWVPFEDLGRTLASADALVAFIDAAASRYSVPSKVLSYLCAARPVLLSMSPDNQAARIVLREKAGLVTAPGQYDEFVEKARWLMANPEVCAQMGANGRAYAERTFQIERIAEKFESAFLQDRDYDATTKSALSAGRPIQTREVKVGT
jgi:colanic acid biosynthesis glycosyl transferase WcaI